MQRFEDAQDPVRDRPATCTYKQNDEIVPLRFRRPGRSIEQRTSAYDLVGKGEGPRYGRRDDESGMAERVRSLQPLDE
jgi:hypothetical protein